MIDARWHELGQILVEYSTEIVPGDRVLITMLEAEALPLVEAIYAAAVEAGAFPHVEYQSVYLDRSLLLHGTMDQLAGSTELQALGMEWADVYIGIRGARNPHELGGIPSERITALKRAAGKVSALRNSTRWVLCRIPNEALAQQAGMSRAEMYDLFFAATLRDWRVESCLYEDFRDLFEGGQEVRLIAPGTDLTFSTMGRRYAIGDGKLNMPDGELFTSPVDDSAEGFISFDYPAMYAGFSVEGIHLEFSSGRVVSAQAQSNEELLHRLLDMDEGSRRLGEFGVGLNFGLQRYCKEILYDEKIGGTIHLALGRAYPECNGVNMSALHWDLVRDMREAGEVLVDGRPVFAGGEFCL